MTNTAMWPIRLAAPKRDVDRLMKTVSGAQLTGWVTWNSLFGEPDPDGDAYTVIATVEFPAGWYIGAGNRSNPHHTQLAIADPGGENQIFLERIVSTPDQPDQNDICYMFRIGQPDPAV